MEKNFDSRALLSGMYDFVTCQRPDGSYYGAGGAKCHKGSESSLPQSESKSGKASAQASKIASALTASQLEEFGLASEADVQRAADNLTKWNEETAKYAEKLKNGEVSKEEMDRMLVQHMDFDPTKTEFLFIGMENGLNPQHKGEDYGTESAGQFSMAKALAQRNLIETGQMSLSDSAVAASSVEVASRNLGMHAGKLDTNADLNSYIGSSASLASQATGGPRVLSKEQTDGVFFGGRKMATIEMSVPPATNVSDGGLNKAGQPVVRKGINSADPNRSMYGAMVRGQAGEAFTGYDRTYVASNFREQRGAYIGKQLQEAAKSPQFQGGFGAPGSGANYTKFQGAVVDPLARSGVPVYQTSVKLSTNQGQKERTHTMHVAELGPGKYFVSGDISMNTMGYAANNNHIQAYQQSIANVKSGKATKYTPPSQKTAAPKTSSATKASTARKSAQATRQTATRQKSATAKRDQELAKLSKSVDKARADRNKFKPGSAAYNKRSAKVNEALTAQRRFKKENDLL